MPIHGGFFNFWEFRQLLAADGSLLRLMAIYGTAGEAAMEAGRANKALEAWRDSTDIEAWGNFGELWQLFGSLWQLMAVYGDL